MPSVGTCLSAVPYCVPGWESGRLPGEGQRGNWGVRKSSEVGQGLRATYIVEQTVLSI